MIDNFKTVDETKLIKQWDEHWIDKEEMVLPRGAKEWRNLCFQIGFEYWQEVFEKFAPGKKILECGAGTSKLSLYMVRLGYDCTMIDNSEIGLNYGRENFKKAGIKGDFIIGDVRELPFRNESFDIVYSGGLLEHFRDVKPIFKEMVRILKPKGVFAANILPKERLFSGQGLVNNISFLGKVSLKIITFQFKGAVKNSRPNFPFYESSKTLQDYKNIMREVGLENVIATGTNPFPSIPFDKLRILYVKLMRLMIPFWRRFDRSNSKFAEIWGGVYTVYGTKTER